MSGVDRAMFYALAYPTGLGRGELAAADRDWIKIWEDGDVAKDELFIPGEFTKNNRRAQQPLMAWMVDELRSWPKMKEHGRLFPGLPRDMIKMFHRDREAARAAWVAAAAKGGDPRADELRAERGRSPFLACEAGEGRLVLHSLRHGYASALLAAGTDLQLAQALTRHSTITLLVDRYGHAAAMRGRSRRVSDSAAANPAATSEARCASQFVRCYPSKSVKCRKKR